MSQDLEIDRTIGRKTYEHHFVTGKVASAEKQLETKVSGGGGGGGSYRGTGYTAPVTVSSTTTTHDAIYLVDGSGQEHALRLQDWDLSVREGHELTAVWLIKKGKSSGDYVAMHNATLKETNYDDKTLAKLHRTWWLVPLSLVLPFVFLELHMGFAWWLVPIGLAAWIYLGIRGRNQLKASGKLLTLAGLPAGG